MTLRLFDGYQKRAAAVSVYCGSSFQNILQKVMLWFGLKMTLDFVVMIQDCITQDS